MKMLDAVLDPERDTVEVNQAAHRLNAAQTTWLSRQWIPEKDLGKVHFTGRYDPISTRLRGSSSENSQPRQRARVDS